jgi:homoserine O-succinyltransferase
MPVQLLVNASKHNSRAGYRESTDRAVHIGLINNMPDGAMERTERQFLHLLEAAADGIVVNLSLYALPDVRRTESGRLHMSRAYSDINDLFNGHIDGLIVTGAEPQCPDLAAEPYWRSLTNIVDWAKDNTHSTIWSCLAAHAAVQHMDGIKRRRLDEKRFGVFECVDASDHRVANGIPSLFRVPHSRWNDLPEAELADCGYSLLTRLRDGGIDAFVRERKSLFVFFQGHPEYESSTLQLEYRRDIGRYLRGERDAYPSMPEGYFERDATDRLSALRERALSHRKMELLADFPSAPADAAANTWSPMATRIYANWLAYLTERKRPQAGNSAGSFNMPEALVGSFR